ncbi:MAG: hypothetical protein IJA34_03840 [Lachnospiraceae bacterium]|nr:hypothetical protein [Lachnospiraceae bacterium]
MAKAESARHYDYSEENIIKIRNAYTTAKTLVADTSTNTETETKLKNAITELQTALNSTGTNTIAYNNQGVYINGFNKVVNAGDCIMYSNTFNGDGIVTAENANIRYTVNVVFKWDADRCVNVVKSVSIGKGNSTPAIQLASDEFLLAAHEWENGLSSSDNPVEYSGTNYNILSKLNVGDVIKLSGASLYNLPAVISSTGVEPCAYAKFISRDSVIMNSRNEFVSQGKFTLLTPEYCDGVLTYENANIHKSLNVIGVWDNEKQSWVVKDKFIGNGVADSSSNIAIKDGEIVIAGLAVENPIDTEDGSVENYENLNLAQVGDKIVFSGISPTSSTYVSIGANIHFVSEGEEEVVTGPINLALNKKYEATTTGNIHTASLTDGKALSTYGEGSWFGFKINGNTDENGVGTVVVDLEDKYSINDIQMHIYAGENDMSIAQPSYVKVYVSDNGVSYNEIGELVLDSSANAPYWAKLNDIEKNGRYVKFEVGASGKSAWVFLNEIEIYGENLEETDKITLSSDYEINVSETSEYKADLTDGVYGKEVTDEWFGFNSDLNSAYCNTVNSVGTVTLDLGVRYDINKVKMHIFAGTNSINAGVPEQVKVLVSTDGKTYVEAGKLNLIKDSNESFWAELAEAKAVGRYVRFEVECSYEWTLINEIEVYGTENVQSETNNIALGSEYVAIATPGENFTADLTDGVTSQLLQYGVNDSSWYGFINTGDTATSNTTADGKGIVVIDLGGMSEITGTSVHMFAGENDLGAKQPIYIRVYYSEDGEVYDFFGWMEYGNETAPYWTSFVLDEAKTEPKVYGRYVKYAFLTNENEWTLFNEIQVYGTRLTSDEIAEPDSNAFVTLAGTFNDWNATPNMKTTEEENVVTTTMELEAGSYEFKILYGTNWYGNEVVVENKTSNEGLTLETTGYNCTLSATGGTYIFKFNKDTKVLNIEMETKSGWSLEGENWYYYNTDGTKALGWTKINSRWYYFDASGIMQSSKWISNRYYVKSNGVMAVSEFVDGGKYYVDQSGAWVKGTKWLQVGDNWYFIKSGTVQISKWAKIGDYYYYFDANGIMQSSKWINNRYYVKSNGTMAVSEFVDGGKYYVDENGLWVKETKWMQIGDNWYYIKSGTVQVSKWAKIGSKYYYFDANGVMQSSKWIGNYYVRADGSMAVSQWIDGKYYVKADGTMAKSEWVDNGRYYVGEDGVWVKNP